MALTNVYLRRKTGLQTLDTAMWAMNHSSLSQSDDAVLMARKDRYILYLTTNRQSDQSEFAITEGYIHLHRMLLGVDLANIQQVILVRPPNLEHSIVQVFRIHIFIWVWIIYQTCLRPWAGQVG